MVGRHGHERVQIRPLRGDRVWIQGRTRRPEGALRVITVERGEAIDRVHLVEPTATRGR